VRKIGKLTASAASVAALGLVVAACSSNGTVSTTASSSKSGCKNASQNSTVAALPGFQVCLFIPATTKANHPDNIIIDGSHVWVGWQNITAKNGSDTKTSTIAEYTTSGTLLKSWSVVGHTDGMRMNPTTHQMWVMCDEDGNPRLYTIDPASSTATTITLPPQPWGGGFDDIQFVNGVGYADASSPTLNSAGKNLFPALYKVTISGTAATLTKVLAGMPKATTINLPVSNVTLNLTDPDSMEISPQGDLVLTSQGDSEMLFIHNLGTAQQTVRVLSTGTQIDDTAWPTSSKGCMIVADGNSGVYSVCSSIWVPGAPYSAAPNDSTVIGFVGTLNPSNGQLTPIIVGIANPHGMGFIPQ
jgi:hypothetical protein